MLGEAGLAAEAGQRHEVGPHGRVALDGQRPAVLRGGPVVRVLVADGPQRLDLDQRPPVAPSRPIPPLTGGGAGGQQVIEDLVVRPRRHRVDGRGDLVEVGAEFVAQEPHLFGEDRAVEGEKVGGRRADRVDRLPERHVVEGDAGALVGRPVGAFLQRDRVDGAAHARQRQGQHPGQVARVQAAAVDRAGSGLARRGDPVPVGGGDAARMEHERGRGHVLARGQQRTDVVDTGGARRVEHAVGVEAEDLVDVGGGPDTDRVATHERAEIGAVLVGRVDAGADQGQVGPVVEDRRHHLGSDSACPPLDDPVHRANVARSEP